MTSSTDNGVLTADGTSGRKVQSTSATIDDAGDMIIDGDLAVNGEMNSYTLSVDTASALIGAVTCSSTLAVAGATTQTGKLTCADEIEIDGALNHDGTTVGFYDTTPAATCCVHDRRAGNGEDAKQQYRGRYHGQRRRFCRWYDAGNPGWRFWRCCRSVG